MSKWWLWFPRFLIVLLALCPYALSEDDEEEESEEEACGEETGTMQMFVELCRPASGAKGVALDETIELTLKDAFVQAMPMMDMLRLRVSREGSDAAVKGDPTFTRATRKFAFKPKQPLRPATKYVARLVVGGGGDSDPLYEWKFETAADGERPPAPPTHPKEQQKPETPRPAPPKEEPKPAPAGRNWLPPVTVGRALRNLDFVEIVPDGLGGALLAWCAEGFLWSSRSSDGATWSKPEAATKERLYEPKASRARSGHLLVHGGRVAMLWSPASGWRELPVPPLGSNPADLLVVHEGQGILVQRQDSLSTLEGSGKWERHALGRGWTLACATSQGDVLLLHRKDSDHPMRWSRLARGSGWSSESLVTMPSSVYGIAGGDNGDAFAYWIQEDPDRKRLYAMRFTARGGWEQPLPADDAEIDLCDQPSIHLDGSGRAIAFWKGARTVSGRGASECWTAIYLPGKGWQPARRMEGIENYLGYLPFALNASGEGVARVETSAGFQRVNRVVLFDIAKGWHTPLDTEDAVYDIDSAADGTAWVALADRDRTLKVQRSPREAASTPAPRAHSIESLEAAAAAGDADAQWRAGCAYLGCEGYPFDAAKALSWMRKSAAQGSWKARHNLAALGYLLYRDDEALQTLRELSREGHGESSAAFGTHALLLVRMGRGDDALRAEATDILLKGASAGTALCQEWLVNFHIQGLLAPGRLTDTQARDFLARAVEQGRGLGTLAEALDRGYVGIAPDPERYRDLTRKLAETGAPNSCSNVANFHAFGQGTPVDMREAVRWYEIAAKCDPLRAPTQSARQGILQSRFNLGVVHRDGLGEFSKDGTAAWQWFWSAAMAGWSDALNALGSACEAGEGHERDLAEATVWYMVAAAHGVEFGAKNVGRMRERGVLDERSEKEIEVRVRARLKEVEAAVRASTSDRNVNPETWVLPEGMTLRLPLIDRDFGGSPAPEGAPEPAEAEVEWPAADGPAKDALAAFERQCYTLSGAGVRGASFFFRYSDYTSAACVWDGKALSIQWSEDERRGREAEIAEVRATFPALFEQLFTGRGLRVRFRGCSLRGMREGSGVFVRVSGGAEDGAVLAFDARGLLSRVDTTVADQDTGKRLPAVEEYRYESVEERALLVEVVTTYELPEIAADPAPGRGRGGRGGGGPPAPKRHRTARTLVYGFGYKNVDGLPLLGVRTETLSETKEGKESRIWRPQLDLRNWKIIERDRPR